MSLASPTCNDDVIRELNPQPHETKHVFYRRAFMPTAAPLALRASEAPALRAWAGLAKRSPARREA
jgi:hypothetical protein